MAIPYLYCLIAAIYFERASLPLVIVGGAFLGLGSAGFYMLWQRLFASFDSDRGNLDLIRGTVYGAIMYFGLYRVAFPFVIASFLLLPFSSLEYARWQAAILYAVYSVVIMLMMMFMSAAAMSLVLVFMMIVTATAMALVFMMMFMFFTTDIFIIFCNISIVILFHIYTSSN